MAPSPAIEYGISRAELRGLGLVGSSPAFELAVSRLARVAACDVAVLLLGETGTGKELFARAAHYCSPRCHGPLIPVNCGAIPDELFENELFGHERGAYTDAREPVAGLIAQADGGTLFLDEVEALTMSAQVKLLRFFEERRFKPLGAAADRHVDTRLVAASNEDLEDRVRRRTFRDDLYYRLRVITISLPPLRERREDIPELASYFVRRAAQEFGRPVPALSAAALDQLRKYDWPGNLRELRNVINAAVVLADRPVIEFADLELSGDAAPAATDSLEPMRAAKARLVRSFEMEYLRKALDASEGNITQAARSARKDRRAFFALLKKYGMTGERAPAQSAHSEITGTTPSARLAG